MRPFLLALLLVVVCLPLFEKLKKQICNGKEKVKDASKGGGVCCCFSGQSRQLPRRVASQSTTKSQLTSESFAPTLALAGSTRLRWSSTPVTIIHSSIIYTYLLQHNHHV